MIGRDAYRLPIMRGGLGLVCAVLCGATLALSQNPTTELIPLEQIDTLPAEGYGEYGTELDTAYAVEEVYGDDDDDDSEYEYDYHGYGHDYSTEYVEAPVWDSLTDRAGPQLTAEQWLGLAEGRSYERESTEEAEERKEERERARNQNPGLDFGSGFFEGLGVLAWVAILALILGLVGYLVYRQGKDTSVDVGRRDYGVTDELLEQSAGEIQSALDGHLAGGDYRNAIRYRFGQVLQLLRRAGHLAWVPGKTNADYLAELPAHLRPGFGVLAQAFNYAYYAGRDVGEEDYRRFSADADAFFVQVEGPTATATAQAPRP